MKTLNFQRSPLSSTAGTTGSLGLTADSTSGGCSSTRPLIYFHGLFTAYFLYEEVMSVRLYARVDLWFDLRFDLRFALRFDLWFNFTFDLRLDLGFEIRFDLRFHLRFDLWFYLRFDLRFHCWRWVCVVDWMLTSSNEWSILSPI